MVTTADQISQLLKPRYQLIGPIPYWEIEAGTVMHLFDFEGNKWFLPDEFSPYGIHESDIAKFPHLFKELPWYEGVKPDLMPAYLKFKGDRGDIKKVKKYILKPGDKSNLWKVTFYTPNRTYFLQNWGPATEQEYLEHY